MPSNSIIQRSGDAFTDQTIARLYRDPGINAGTLFAFDFLDAYCNPNPDGALAGGAAFKNLVDGGADATYAPATGGNSATIAIANAAGKAGITSSGQTSNIATGPLINLGAPQGMTDKPFLVTLWSKLTGLPFNPVNLIADINDANATRWAWGLYTSTTAGSVSAVQRAGGGATALQAGPHVSTAVRQLAVGWNAGTLTLYANGVAVASSAGLASPLTPTGLPPFLNMATPGTYYRASMERLDLSGRSALAAVQADYALNNGRFG